MKKLIFVSRTNTLVGIVLCSILFAFTSFPGAHSVQVYLDDKLVIDQYISFKKPDVQKLTLNPTEKVRNLIVKYNECGRTVTGRTISLKDENNKVLKNWSFQGGTGFQNPMSCEIKDIVALKQKGSNTLKLYYSSNEFPEGQQIASLIISGTAITASK